MTLLVTAEHTVLFLSVGLDKRPYIRRRVRDSNTDNMSEVLGSAYIS